MFEPRIYRNHVFAEGLSSFEVHVNETDLLICADQDFATFALESVHLYRNQLEQFILRHKIFRETFTPIEIPIDAPEIVKAMGRAAKLAGVGPMASVAGAIAQFVGKDLLRHSREVIIENGGDIFIKTDSERSIGIYAGQSPLSDKIAILIKPEDTPLGICTSSGTVGHSTSFGQADAVVILSKDVSLADATATRVGNMVRTKDDIKKAIEFAQGIPGIDGAIIILGDSLGGWGKFEFVPA